MIVGKLKITEEIIKEISGIVKRNRSKGITRISEIICKEYNLINQKGSFKKASCIKMLNKLRDKGKLAIDKIRKQIARRNHKEGLIARQEIRCELKELGRIELVEIKEWRSKESELWNIMMEKYHYIGKSRLCGSLTPIFTGSKIVIIIPQFFYKL